MTESKALLITFALIINTYVLATPNKVSAKKAHVGLYDHGPLLVRPTERIKQIVSTNDGPLLLLEDSDGQQCLVMLNTSWGSWVVRLKEVGE